MSRHPSRKLEESTGRALPVTIRALFFLVQYQAFQGSEGLHASRVASAPAVFRQHVCYLLQGPGLPLSRERPDAQWTVRRATLGADFLKASQAKKVLVGAHVHRLVFDVLEAPVSLQGFNSFAPIDVVCQPEAVPFPFRGIVARHCVRAVQVSSTL